MKYDRGPFAVYWKLGYPSKNTINKWYHQYMNDKLKPKKIEKKSKYSENHQKNTIEYYLEYGKSVGRTIKVF